MRYLWIIFWGFIGLSGCDFEQIKTVDIPLEHLIVLNGTIMPDSLLTVHVSQTTDTQGIAGPPTLPTADVQFYEDGVLLGKATYQKKGYYRLDVYPKAGKTYKVVAKAAHFPQAEAEVIVLVAPVIRLETESTTVGDGYVQTKATVHLQDDKDTKSLYHLRVITYHQSDFGDGNIQYYSNPSCSSESPYIRNRGLYFAFNQGDLQYICSGLVLLEDDLFNGKEVALDLSFLYQTGSRQGETTRTYLMFGEVPTAFKTYLISANGQHTDEGFFLSEPFNVQGNVKGGLGLVTAFSGIQVEMK